jgi:hypothetical protein
MLAICLCANLGGGSASADPATVIGGDLGSRWVDGGGDIPALVIRTDRKAVEQTNTPGGVVDFAPPGWLNWIFPQRADTTVNIAIGADSDTRGGSILSPNAPRIANLLPLMIDGDLSTALDMTASLGSQGAQVLGIIINLDLGARFGVNRFRFFPRNADPAFPTPEFPRQNDFIRGYEVFINDGTPENQIEGVPILTTVAVEGQNEEPVVDIKIPPQYVRFVRLKSIATRGFEVAELQVFGTGYVPEARYVSNIYDFGAPAILGRLRWVQQQIGDPGLSRVRVRTRTGHDAQPVEFNKIRPGEDIFRQGGGVASADAFNPLFTATGGANRSSRPEVPWKAADDVDEPELSDLIRQVLDNEEVDVRDAREAYKDLSIAEQEIISLTLADYGQLGARGKQDPGVIRDDLINWSAWSPPYPATGIVDAVSLQDNSQGVPMISPGPRRYFQFSLDFASEDFEAATGVGGLAFEAIATPYAEQLIAEVAPRDAILGKRTHFGYAVLSQIGEGTVRGFDRFRVTTPLRVESIGRVAKTTRDGQLTTADFTDQSLDDLPLTDGEFSIVDVSDDGFTIAFERIDADSTLLRVDFDTAVLRFGTVFSGYALDTQSDTDAGQAAIAGNAADLALEDFDDPDRIPVGLASSGNLAVSVSTSSDLLINVSAMPPVFSPNGDGINDTSNLGYDITNIAFPVPLTVTVFDLSGRRVRKLLDATGQSGRFAPTWDGRDDEANLAPPGTYVFSVTLEAGTGTQRKAGVVHLAY